LPNNPVLPKKSNSCPKSPTILSRLRQGGAFLVLVFVIWILNLHEVTAFSVRLTKEQLSAECGSSDIISAVHVVQVSDAIKVRRGVPSSDFGIFCNRLNKVWKRTVSSGLQHSTYRPSESELVIWRKRSSASDYQKINGIVEESRIGSAIVDANNSHFDGVIVPKLIHQPDAFDANFGTMSRKKFVSSEVQGYKSESTLLATSLPQGPSKSSDKNCCNSGYETVVSIEDINNPKSNEWAKMVLGALFCVSVLVWAAYFIFGGKEK
jgi:hypothetical protein